MLSLLCALTENWRPGDHGWKVFPIAGHDFGGGGRKLMGHSSGITSTIAKWKPFLEGGNKELSVWAAPFGQGEILSAATAPPSRLSGWLRQRGRVGRVPRQCHVPQLHWQLLRLASSIYMKRRGRKKTSCSESLWCPWTMNLWLSDAAQQEFMIFCSISQRKKKKKLWLMSKESKTRIE